jgi:hypothetical protein
METIHEQTGMTLPEWQFGRLNKHNQTQEIEDSGKLTNGLNGRGKKSSAA